MLPTAPTHVTDAIRGKVCLVTGASRTLGAVIARRLAAHSGHVAVNYLHAQEAARTLCHELTACGGVAHPIQADVREPDQVAQLVTETVMHLGPIDILVNTVGPYLDTPFLELAVADFDQILAGNLRATFLLCQAVGHRMKAQGQGHIINLAATDSRHRSHSVYGLAKSGVVYLTEALALEVAPEVHINAIAPDLIADNEAMAPTVVQQALAGTPLGRLVTRGEIADLVCLLCSPAFASMTGQTLVLDGGRSLPRIAVGLPRVEE